MGLLSTLSPTDLQKIVLYVGSIPICFLLYTLIQRCYASFFGPLRNVPGPWLARYTRLWELSAVWPGNFEKWNFALHKRHGKIIRIAPNKYTIDDPDAVRIIYGHGTKFNKATFYEAFREPTFSNIFAETNIKEHSQQRRKIGSLYSMTSLLSYESFIDDCNAILLDKLTKFSHEHRAVQIVEFLQFYAFDVIGTITAGKSFGLMEAESDVGSIIKTIHTVFVYSSRMALFPELHPWIIRTARALKLGEPTAPLQQYINYQIAQRRQGVTVGNKNKNDFLTKLLRLEDGGSNTPFDTWNSCSSNITAGSDTTAITISAVLYYMLRNPETLRKVREEIERKAAEGAVSNPITYAQAQELPYMQAVLKEALRMHPAAMQPLMRRVPAGGAVIAGTWFPEGVEVGINPCVAHRNQSVFGKDAEVFRPERWLEADKEELSKMDAYFLAFGSGSRSCIGKHISLLEISKVIPQLVTKFDFEFVEPEKEWETRTAFFCKQNYRCYIKARAT